ncbi:O-antigen ligase family protein [Sphingobacterium multivorum]|uniref:O-antigen ligase family protein n=1 Tax=Sphingobacterium multivorum TaxID=28454 RepID=UPI0028A24D71|nr:O-antigen ligase family protein [Sphingobacterium multivorum]
MDKINSVDLEMARNRLEIVGDRYRALSVFQYSFTYGLVSSLFSLFFIYVFGFWPKYKQYGIIGFIAGGIGVVLSFSRTVFLSYCIGLLFFVLLAYDIGKILKYFVVCIITLSITYLISPTFEQNVNNAVGIFSGGESVGGNSSSVEMREIQFLGAFRYFLQNPVFGNGFGYIDQELGWADKTRNEYDLEMQGFESLVYQLMIEQGIVGLILCCFLGVLILLFAFKRLKYSEIRGESSLLISLFLTFFVFAVGTGPLGNWEITLLFIGLLTKLALLTRAYLWKKQSRLGGKNNKKQYAY